MITHACAVNVEECIEEGIFAFKSVFFEKIKFLNFFSKNHKKPLKFVNVSIDME